MHVFFSFFLKIRPKNLAKKLGFLAGFSSAAISSTTSSVASSAAGSSVASAAGSSAAGSSVASASGAAASASASAAGSSTCEEVFSLYILQGCDTVIVYRMMYTPRTRYVYTRNVYTRYVYMRHVYR